MPTTSLVRVMRDVKRKRPDGRLVTYKRAFYVKKANPGDRYSLKQPESPQRPVSNSAPPVEQDVEQNDAEQGLDYVPVQDEDLTRIEVQPLDIPWDMDADSAAADPVPEAIRIRYAKGNRSSRHTNPINSNIPIYYVKPGEDLLWGSVDSEMLNRLRTGVVSKVKPAGTNTSTFLSKIECTDGMVERAYIRFEALVEQKIYDLYGAMYDLDEDDGSLSRRAAAAYEIAKSVGLDDLIPPTVYRYNEHNGLEPVLSTTAIDDLSIALDFPKSELVDKMGQHTSVQLWCDGTSCLSQQSWMLDLINDKSLLNEFYSNCGPCEPQFIRAAVFDFIAWTGCRTLADLVFCSNARHPMHLISNDLILPDPIAMGTSYIDYQRKYSDGCPANVQYMPMIWSDMVSMAALRGYEPQAMMYEEVAVECARRLKGDRVIDLIRSLSDHKIGPLAIAGLLVRVAFLRYGSRIVMRNPLLVAEYFSSLITGQPFDPGFDIDLNEMENSIDKAINKATMGGFSFVSTMSGSNDEEESVDGD